MADNVILNPGAGGDTIAGDDIGGVVFQRNKLIHGVDGTNDGDVARSNPLPVHLVNTGRTEVRYYAIAAAAGATTVETAVTLTESRGTSATSNAASFVVTSGKRLRITSITFAARGHNTATAQATTFRIRVNTGGAVTTSSTPIILAGRVATPATANSWDRLVVQLPADGIEIPGDGTLQWGVTANATYTTNAPTWDVLITGYEY